MVLSNRGATVALIVEEVNGCGSLNIYKAIKKVQEWVEAHNNTAFQLPELDLKSDLSGNRVLV